MAFKTDSIKLKNYADNAARNTGIPSPVNGDLCVNNGSLQIYNGSWIAVDASSGLTVANFDAAAVLAGGEAFADDDLTVMTAAAVNDLIESKNYLTSETSHSDVLVDGDFSSSGLMTSDGAGGYSITTNNFLTSETSHADVVVDGDFTQNGIMIRTGAGAYSAITDNSSNWDTAYTWGDHSSEGYIDQDSDIMASLGVDYTVPDNVGHNIIAITGDPSTFEFIFTKSTLGNWSSTGQQKVEIINASSYSQTINGDGGGSPAVFYLINTATDSLGSITIDPNQRAIIIPNMSDNSGRHFVLLTSI